VLITEPPGAAAERTWRLPLATRVAQVVACAIVAGLPAGYLAVTLWASHVPDGPWIALAGWLAAVGALAARVLTQSVTLTPDTLVIRNILTTTRLPLAAVTAVGFSRSGKLRVTGQRGTFGDERHVVRAVFLGSSYWSGRRDEADDVADAIAAAAGLAPLPPRRQIIGPTAARLILIAGSLAFAVGIWLGPMSTTVPGGRPPIAVGAAGVLLYVGGMMAAGFGFRLTRDHRRQRRRRPAELGRP
jgi:hypothetical protein